MAAGGVLLAALLLLIGWTDYQAVSRDLRAAVRAQATALAGTIAAAARVQHEGADQAARSLGERLLETARLVRGLDAKGALTPETVSTVIEDQPGLRILVFDRDGRRTSVGGDAPPGPGTGRGFGRGGAPWSPGAGPGMSRVAEQLIAGGEDEIIAAAPMGREGHERVAAGVRRAGGGAIVVNAANRAAEQIEEAYSFDRLLAQLSSATPSLAYVAIEEDGQRVAHGPLASSLGEASLGPAAFERETAIGDVHVLERQEQVTLAPTRQATLRIAMRLDEVRAAERRALARVTIGLSSIAALAALGLAFASLRARYGALSVRHERAQQALRRRDRLAAMGEMASTVAHEIRNPLNAIAMGAQRLRREYSDEDTERAGLVQVIEDEASRIDNRVQQFLEFARPRPLNRATVHLSELISGLVNTLRPLAASRGIDLATETGGAGTALVDPEQLRQALDNLVRNAIDASPPPSIVTVTASSREREHRIAVTDHGPGIPPEILPRVFDLYFTTKREGTGVGLAIAQQIVVAHGGTIEVTTAPGAGTTMTVVLPDGERADA
jgi:signal transduction histidine kinase